MNEIEYLNKNLKDIREKYSGLWIAIIDTTIVASALDLPHLLTKIIDFKKPFITFVPPEPTIWNFIYAS